MFNFFERNFSDSFSMSREDLLSMCEDRGEKRVETRNIHKNKYHVEMLIK
jgi:hypothetical protein